MLFRFLSWRITKTALILSLILSTVFLFAQLVQLDQVLFKTPPKESALFLSVWLLYFFSYFFPSSLAVAFGWVFFDLKENRKLSVIASFGIDPKGVFFKTFLFCLPLFLASAFAGFFIKQEDISYLRKFFLYRHYINFFKGIPEKGFYSFGKITIRVEERSGMTFRGVLLKMDDNLISAKEAIFQDQELVLKDGSLVVKKDNKYYLTKFQTYRLSLSNILPESQKKKKESLFLPVINGILAVALTFGIFYAVLKLINKHTRLYYLLSLSLIVYHLTLILIRLRL